MEACREWRKRRTSDKTWNNLKTDFTEEYNDMHEMQASSGDLGFAGFSAGIPQSSSQSSSIAEALENLSQEVTTDTQTMATLTSTNATLTTQLAEAQKKIAELTSAIRGLVPSKRKLMGTYFWTHGFWISSTHSSANFPNKEVGHNDAATKDNMLGGSKMGLAQWQTQCNASE